jgi:hypothetical protein
VTRTTTTRLIAEQLPSSNDRKRLTLKPKLDPKGSHLPSFLNKSMHLKGIEPWKTAIIKKIKAESPLYIEINALA